MAANFRITTRRKGSNLHLKLKGDFDGMSAMELIYALKENLGFAEKVYIETDELSCLHPFGRDVLRKNFAFAPATLRRICFVGVYGQEIAPENVGFIRDKNPKSVGACCRLRPTSSPKAKIEKQLACS